MTVEKIVLMMLNTAPMLSVVLRNSHLYYYFLFEI